MIINCKDLKAKKVEHLKELASKRTLRDFAIVQVEGDKASEIYTKSKKALAEEIGVKCDLINIHYDVSYEALKKTLLKVSCMYDGVILQLPLPAQLEAYEQDLLDLIPYHKDVDGLTTTSIGKLHSGRAYHTPCTAKAVLDILDEYDYNLEGKNVLIIGRQNLLGYPLHRLMTDRNTTVTLAHSRTKNISQMLSSGYYDVVISAVGNPQLFKYITTEFIIDVGINRDEETGKLCGDIDLDTCKYKYATTVGNGVSGIGVLTCCNIFENLLTK